VSTLASTPRTSAAPCRASRPSTYAANLALLPGYVALAREIGCSPAQLALAWVLAQGEHEENHAAATVQLTADQVARASALIGRHNVVGPRYNSATQTEIDTEEFPA
jgi:aryl-alcohol dehydrogenase-like predicted oxidoreductase